MIARRFVRDEHGSAEFGGDSGDRGRARYSRGKRGECLTSLVDAPDTRLVPVLIHVPVDLQLLFEVRDNRTARSARWQMFKESLV
jgi:hypothetical protein